MTDQTRSDGRLRVATWNLRSGLSVDLASLWWRRRRYVARVLAEVDADVWGFQEVFAFQRRWLLRSGLPGGAWDNAGEGRNRSRRGEAVPVAWQERKAEVESSSTAWFGAEPRRPGSVAAGASAARVATTVDLVLPGGARVRIVNTHLDDRSPHARHAAASQLVQWLAARGDDVPLVVTGDLNATHEDDELAPLVDAGLVHALPHHAGPTATAFETEAGRRLDHVLVSPHWEVVSAEVVTSAGRASDHYPVVADLRLR